MKNVVTMNFGSTLYGTRMPDSDTDLKSIFIPTGRDIVMCRADSHQDQSTNTKRGVRNKATDTDDNGWSLQEYLRLLVEGRTGAFDMLFAPPHHILKTSSVWGELQANKDKLVHKGISAFLGYVKAQAEKYSLRGNRILTLEKALTSLRSLDQSQAVGNIALFLIGICEAPKYIHHAEQQGKLGIDSFISVCGKYVNYHNKVKVLTALVAYMLQEYGARARKAAVDGGMDVKSFYHAVRIGAEAEELLLTGNITFPRPEAEYLLRIRRNEIGYDEVCANIEAQRERVDAALLESTLPEAPDLQWIEDFVYEHHLREIIGYHSKDDKEGF